MVKTAVAREHRQEHVPGAAALVSSTGPTASGRERRRMGHRHDDRRPRRAADEREREEPVREARGGAGGRVAGLPVTE